MKTIADLYHELIELENEEVGQYADLQSPFIKKLNWADYNIEIDWSSTKPRYGWEDIHFKTNIIDITTKNILGHLEHELKFQNIDNKPCYVPGCISELELLTVAGMENDHETFFVYGDEE